MSKINQFLRENEFLLRDNPCISPDFCLNWPALSQQLQHQDPSVHIYESSVFTTAEGCWQLAENEEGDCAWVFTGPDTAALPLEDGRILTSGRRIYPATWPNLLHLKNLVLAHDPQSTIFPTAAGTLRHTSIGVGARFTTLHWPAVDWTMARLGLSLTANQNSIPRELVYDVEAMLEGRLDTVPFPFIGAEVPEGHQGQSVEGMSHGCVLEKLKSGFHQLGLPWGFNADHQPIGGKYDGREDRLVQGSLLASYITFDLSPELLQTLVPADADACAAWVAREIPDDLLPQIHTRLRAVGLAMAEEALYRLLCTVWPALLKMKRRDDKYRAIREKYFAVETGRAYFRELSIDELPGLTTPETTAVMLTLCELLGMPVQFIAPAFGFQKNLPFADQEELRRRVQKQWEICQQFGVSIGFHSGSGKSAENYRLLGEITGGRLEIKTSGRYTYEMGRALAASSHPEDQALWRDWFAFTCEVAASGAFSEMETERRSARKFLLDSLPGITAEKAFASLAELRARLAALPPDPDLPLWFEYNFLFVLAAGGRPDKSALGDHSASGYRQRARFYRISEEARQRYFHNVASYLLFLCESTGLASPEKCQGARRLLEQETGLADRVVRPDGT